DDGSPPEGFSSSPSISADGRFVVFASTIDNLVENDHNGVSDVFLFDLMNDSISRLSVSNLGTEGWGASGEPFISPNGNYVVFESEAPNLVPGDNNGVEDIFLYDRIAITIE